MWRRRCGSICTRACSAVSHLHLTAAARAAGAGSRLLRWCRQRAGSQELRGSLRGKRPAVLPAAAAGPARASRTRAAAAARSCGDRWGFKTRCVKSTSRGRHVAGCAPGAAAARATPRAATLLSLEGTGLGKGLLTTPASRTAARPAARKGTPAGSLQREKESGEGWETKRVTELVTSCLADAALPPSGCRHALDCQCHTTALLGRGAAPPRCSAPTCHQSRGGQAVALAAPNLRLVQLVAKQHLARLWRHLQTGKRGGTARMSGAGACSGGGSRAHGVRCRLVLPHPSTHQRCADGDARDGGWVNGHNRHRACGGRGGEQAVEARRQECCIQLLSSARHGHCSSIHPGCKRS